MERYKREFLGVGGGGAGAPAASAAGAGAGTLAAVGEGRAGEEEEEEEEEAIGPAMPPPSHAGASSSSSSSSSSSAAGGGGGGGGGAAAAAAASSAYGSFLLPGEGAAIASYVQANKRVPRRGEVSWDGAQIDHLESVGYVMSGNRHKRMNEVRIRKENQVYSAEEKRALALCQFEQQQEREAKVMESFRAMLQKVKGGAGGAAAGGAAASAGGGGGGGGGGGDQ